MPAQLLALTDGPSILLDKPILLFGRHPECDIQLNSRKVSRRHCCLAQVSDYLVIRDLGSTNGVRINGTRVTEGRLRTGDELTIGNFRYQIYWDPPENGEQSSRKFPVNDVDLEEADEPIELNDLPPDFVPLPSQPAESDHVERDSDGSFRLPDHLDLMPLSDSKNNINPSNHPPSRSD